MKRSRINFIIDAIAFIGVVLLISTGVLMRFILLPGVERMERGPLLLWGMSRHQWGDVHFFIAMGLMVILALHLALHWRWVASVAEGESRQTPRLWLGALSVLTLLAVAVAPYFSPMEKGYPKHRRGSPPSSPMHSSPQATERPLPAETIEEPQDSSALEPPPSSADRDFRAADREPSIKPPAENRPEPLPHASGIAGADEPAHAPKENFIRGGMTLREYEDATGMAYPELLRALGVPVDTDAEEKLGRLGKQYGFTMHEVRRIARDQGGG